MENIIEGDEPAQIITFRDMVSKLDPDEWLIPETFLDTNSEFLQALVNITVNTVVKTEY
jgi:hypothetical protein